VEYSADISCPSDPRQNPVFLFVPGTTQELSRVIGPEDVSTDPQYKPAPPIFRARGGLFGQQIRGGEPAKSPVAVYRFQGARPAGSGDRVSFEMRVGIERSGEEASESEDTRVELTFVDRQTGQLTATQIVRPENRRTAYFDAPAAPVRSGNFDVYLRNLTTGHFVGLKNVSLSLVVSREFFDFNLVKSLLILWLFSILVIVIAVFCSTFLSWPIATVLTLLILLGHWGVEQLGDSLSAGIGNRVATDIFGASSDSSASSARVVSSVVDRMSRVVSAVGAVLPDIQQFSAIEDIERGTTISARTLEAPLVVLAMFGMPTLVLSYVVLRNKEVAP
jgi:hypothetical protein